ncbi:MAG TPA: general stress protein [Candidatus Melainabacteria bacterium]|nr:general stress protein [Candidatus Melainabacteria bacterium]HIN67174.1 general stress protein [Candidatus Obscuribacterales bacterium]
MTGQNYYDEDSKRKLQELIKDIKVAMLTTVSADGQLRSRPMATHEVNVDDALWFLTNTNTAKVAEVSQQEQVNLVYMDVKSQRYVSISGSGQTYRDTAKVHELWNPLMKAWFPKGPDDPMIAVLRVTPEYAEYWDAPSYSIVQLFGFLKAAVTGEEYKEEGTEHEKIDLSKTA